MQMEDLIFLLFLFLTSLFCFYLLRQKKQQKNLPPGPQPWPIIGNALQIKKTRVHSDLADMARSHGPIISIKLGSQLVVVASSATAAMEILKTHDRSLSARFVPHAARIGTYIENSLAWAFHCDERWKRLRTFCKTELFASKTLDSQSQLRQKKVSELVSLLLRKEGEVVNIGEVVFTTVFNILGNVFFSRDVFDPEADIEAPGLKNLITRAMELTMAPNLADFYPLFCRMDIQGLQGESAAFVDKIYNLWEGYIEERRKMGSDPNIDFLKSLIDAGFSDLQIKALLLDMFAAGTDTSTSLVDWTMSELMRNPEAMGRVRDELERVVGEERAGGNAVAENHLVCLSYLQACIKETLRLHPPVPLLLPRQALQDCKVMNYTIPKDCRILVNVWAIGRDLKTWEDPLTFSPKRFLGSSMDYKGNDFEFTPFGAGRRICPGMPLATRLVQLILASLIYNFDWSLPDGIQPKELNMDEKFGLTLEREQPLLLIPKSLEKMNQSKFGEDEPEEVWQFRENEPEEVWRR